MPIHPTLFTPLEKKQTIKKADCCVSWGGSEWIRPKLFPSPSIVSVCRNSKKVVVVRPMQPPSSWDRLEPSARKAAATNETFWGHLKVEHVEELHGI